MNQLKNLTVRDMIASAKKLASLRGNHICTIEHIVLDILSRDDWREEIERNSGLNTMAVIEALDHHLLTNHPSDLGFIAGNVEQIRLAATVTEFLATCSVLNRNLSAPISLADMLALVVLFDRSYASYSIRSSGGIELNPDITRLLGREDIRSSIAQSSSPQSAYPQSAYPQSGLQSAGSGPCGTESSGSDTSGTDPSGTDPSGTGSAVSNNTDTLQSSAGRPSFSSRDDHASRSASAARPAPKPGSPHEREMRASRIPGTGAEAAGGGERNVGDDSAQAGAEPPAGIIPASKRHGPSTEGSRTIFSATSTESGEYDAGAYPGDHVDEDSIVGTPVSEVEAKAIETLEKFAVNLVTQELRHRSLNGEPSVITVGREDKLDRMIQILMRKKKGSILLLGDSGVGKTHLVHALVDRIARGDVPAQVKPLKIWDLRLSSLVAGTRLRGDLEERMEEICKAVLSIPNSLLFIDDIDQLTGAGAATSSTQDTADLLLSSLQQGIRVIGTTTHQAARATIESKRTIMRQFQSIRIEQTTLPQTRAILDGIRQQYEMHHGVVFDLSVLDALPAAAERCMPKRRLPDSAIDLLDECASFVRLDHHLRHPDTAAPDVLPVTPEDLDRVIEAVTGIPGRASSRSERERMRSLEKSLTKAVFGQDEAVRRVSQAVRVSRAGLRDRVLTIGNYLFAGPTGVGKTELARQIAKVLGVEMIRFDMSEFMESHSVARLIGAPPGYHGHDKGGKLVEAVSANPYCVLLLDEIEKAHPSVFNILLQIMDDGRLTDGSGKTADFRNVLLIMTTNAGVVEKKEAMGFGRDNSLDSGFDESAIKRLFTPEFRNRLDAVVPFNALSEPVARQVADKMLIQIRAMLAERRVTFNYSPAARDWIAGRGHSVEFGARPMRRLVQEAVSTRLSQDLLYGDLADGGTVHLGCSKGELTFRIEKSDVNAKVQSTVSEPAYAG